MKRYLICIPTYNESESIEELLHRFGALLTKDYSLEILVIDDNSPDGTADIVDNVHISKPLHLLRRSRKEGLGPAYIAGFTWGLSRSFDFFVECDADGSHQPEELDRLIDASRNSDLVIGTRWMPQGEVVNWPLLRRIISKTGTFYAQKALGLPFKDLTSGYRIYSAKALESLNFTDIATQGYGFQIEMAMRVFDKGLRITEVPITFVERQQGRSKMSRRIVLEALVQTTKWGAQRRFKWK